MAENLTFPITKQYYDVYKPHEANLSALELSSLPLFDIYPHKLIVKQRKVFSPGKNYVTEMSPGNYEMRRTPDTTYTTEDYFIEFEPGPVCRQDANLQTLAWSYINSFDSKFKIVEAPYFPKNFEEFHLSKGKHPISRVMRIIGIVLPLIFATFVAVNEQYGALWGKVPDEKIMPLIPFMLIAMFTLLLAPILINVVYRGKPYEKLSKGQKKACQNHFQQHFLKKCPARQQGIILEALRYRNRNNSEFWL